MKTPYPVNIRTLIAPILLILLLFMIADSLKAQVVSPYAITPDWAYGNGSRTTFPNGNFPNSGAPVMGVLETMRWNLPEASTSICFSDGSMALYTNTVIVYNSGSTAWNDFVRNLSTDNTCAGSATGGAVAFPDPASPTNAFYLILANDETGGTNCSYKGMHLYRFTGTGSSVAYSSHSQLNDTNFPSEAVTVGTDGTGGYWVVTHYKGTGTGTLSANTFRVWHFTASGISPFTDYTVGATIEGTTMSQSYLKFSPCQDKIAYHAGKTIVVHSFDRTNGVVGAELRRVVTSPIENGVGLEFSPDGNRIFHNGLGVPATPVKYFDIATGIDNTIAGASSWSLQMGPDGKIYTSPYGSAGLGVISNPNTTPSFSTITQAPTTGIHFGLINLAWLTPRTPDFNATIPGANACERNLAHVFQNYFLTNVTPDPASFLWTFNDGTGATSTQVSPTHTFPDGTWNVQLSFKDQMCGHTWNVTKSVTINCPMPVDWLDIDAKHEHGKVRVSWSTATEINNDYFEVQRSIDGINFVTIGTVDSKGNSQQIQEYYFDDFSPLSGGSYYRIIQHDIDGLSTNSPNAYVNIASSVISVHPNPTTSSFELNISGSDEATVVVTDVLGRVVYQTQLSGETMSVSFGEELTPGAYSLQVITNDQSHTEKLIKK